MEHVRPKVNAAVTTSTDSAVPITALHTGTAVRPRPGSRARRTPADAVTGAPAAFGRAARVVGVPPVMAVLTCFPAAARCGDNERQDVVRRRGVVSAVWMRLRSELRTRWRAWLGLALLIGLAGAAAVAAAAGARRTETAYPRFVQAQNGYDLVTGGFPGRIDPARALAKMEALPEVGQWARVDMVASAAILPSGGSPACASASSGSWRSCSAARDRPGW
jgi:hypothetical protein